MDSPMDWRRFRDTRYLVAENGQVQNEITGHILKPFSTGRYDSVRFGHKAKNLAVHFVVAEVFLGKKPFGKEVNHKDGNKTHNHWLNLEYVSHQENQAHASRTGLMATGERHGTRTHPEAIVRGDRHWTRRRNG